MKYQYPDFIWKDFCGHMANLVADSGYNKEKLSYFVEAICPTGGGEWRNFTTSKKGACTCICRLLEPTRAHSRVLHVQTPEA